MTTTDPTPLAEQIAREHLALLNTSTWLIVGCTCDPTLTAPPSGAAGWWYAAHIATVTEQAARERMRAAGPTAAAVVDLVGQDVRAVLGDRAANYVEESLRQHMDQALAVVGQGVTAEQAWDEGLRAGEAVERARWQWSAGATARAVNGLTERPERPANPYRAARITRGDTHA